MKRNIAIATAVMVSTSAAAFDVDGFRTGMTVDEVAARARSQGWQLAKNNVFQGSYSEYRFDANGKVSDLGPAGFGFCDSGQLVAYNVSIDFDTEYVPKLRELVQTYREQPHVTVEQSLWGGSGGGYIQSVRLRWLVGKDRIDIEFSPEGRTGAGSLKYNRGASVSYFSLNLCPKK